MNKDRIKKHYLFDENHDETIDILFNKYKEMEKMNLTTIESKDLTEEQTIKIFNICKEEHTQEDGTYPVKNVDDIFYILMSDDRVIAISKYEYFDGKVEYSIFEHKEELEFIKNIDCNLIKESKE